MMTAWIMKSRSGLLVSNTVGSVPEMTLSELAARTARERYRGWSNILGERQVFGLFEKESGEQGDVAVAACFMLAYLYVLCTRF